MMTMMMIGIIYESVFWCCFIKIEAVMGSAESELIKLVRKVQAKTAIIEFRDGGNLFIAMLFFLLVEPHLTIWASRTTSKDTRLLTIKCGSIHILSIVNIT